MASPVERTRPRVCTLGLKTSASSKMVAMSPAWAISGFWETGLRINASRASMSATSLPMRQRTLISTPHPRCFTAAGRWYSMTSPTEAFSQLSTGAKGVLVLGALVGVVLAVSNGTSSEGPASPPPDPGPTPPPAPTPASAAAGVVGQALSPSSIAGFFNKAFSGAGSGGTERL